MNTKHHLKTILPLAAVAAVFALAPVAQAEVIDSYNITASSTETCGHWSSAIHIVNPLGYNSAGDVGTGPFTLGTNAGAWPGLTGDDHVNNHNGNGQFDNSQDATGQSAWIKFDLGQNYNLEELRVWNGDFIRVHDAGAGNSYGMKQVDLYYSSAAADPGDDFTTGWTLIGTQGIQQFSEIANVGGQSGGSFPVTDEIALNGINARWFALMANSSYNGIWMKIAEVQFIEAVGPAVPFAITEIDYASTTGMLTLTWNSRPNETYGVYLSTDMIDWGFELDDSIPADAVETTTTVTFDLNDTWPGPDGIPESVYFRVEK